MNPKDFQEDLLKGIDVDLSEEFDRNFERKAFFDKTWDKRKLLSIKTFKFLLL